MLLEIGELAAEAEQHLTQATGHLEALGAGALVAQKRAAWALQDRAAALGQRQAVREAALLQTARPACSTSVLISGA
jgi:hypothetical protein